MKVKSIWDKTNAVELTDAGEFIESYDNNNPIGREGEFLIKFPRLNSDIFFRLNSLFGRTIEFISDKPTEEGFKMFYNVDYDDADFPIDVYDNNKKLIRSITPKDLYSVYHICSDTFVHGISGAIVRITLYDEKMKKRMSCISKVKEYDEGDDTDVVTVRHIINNNSNNSENDITAPKMPFITGEGIIEYDMTFEVLDTSEFEKLMNKMFE